MKDYSAKLRKIIRKNQYKDFDEQLKTRNRMMILKSKENKVLWTNGSILIINDPTMIKSIGGEYLIKNYLNKSPTIYDIVVKDNSLQIINENKLEEMSKRMQELIVTPKQDLSQTTIEEFEKLKEKRGLLPSRDYINYIKRTFEDKNLETYDKNNVLLYLFEEDSVRAIIG